MTVIAVKDGVIAADSQYTSGDLIGTGQKLYEVGGDFIGFSGYHEDGLLFIEWYSGTISDKKDKPKVDEYFSAIVLKANGEVFTYGEKYMPIPIEEPFWAIGNGKYVAMGAMAAGKDASEAVAIACDLVDGCGLPVIVEGHFANNQ